MVPARLPLLALTFVLLLGSPASADGQISQALGELPFAFQVNSYASEGSQVVASGNYEYGPSVVEDGGVIRMWYCAGGDGWGDGIYYVQSTSWGASWSAPVEVIRASRYRGGYLDHTHACDPSVVRHGDYWFILYTGAPDWGASTCNGGHGGERGVCDNRIFAARVPYSQPGTRTSYQKLVNVGECTGASCFQWRYFWQNNDTYPPVPVVRSETGVVWRKIGTGGTGYTTQQTRDYGIGQPSVFNLGGRMRIWFTNDRPSSSDRSVQIWVRPIIDFDQPQWFVDVPSWQEKRVANRNNDVNYNVTWDGSRNRWAAGAAPGNYPCVHYAHRTGLETTLPPTANPNDPDATNDHVISRNLNDQATCHLTGAEGTAHNDGFLRGWYGELRCVPGRIGGSNYNWLYYANNSSLIHTPDNGKVNINRIAFRINGGC